MRVCWEESNLIASLQTARAEADAAFKNPSVYLEKFIDRPKHVEVQILADSHGNIVHCWERDCSLQRRHQKLVEESPAPTISSRTRRRMCEAAVRLARTSGYVNAGTCEFLVDADQNFYFIEVNARIQVEHPVTELVTGVDLVAEQLAIAAGNRVTTWYSAEGHAVEVRLYAEDPRSFLPQAGRIERLRLPTGIRIDAGVEEGDEIGLAYDPMIAKLIAQGRTRQEALDRLADALRETVVEGVTTNLPFLRWLVGHPDLRSGETTTAFLVEHPPLSARPTQAAQRPWRRPFRLNLPAPPPAPPPDPDAAAGAHGAGGGERAVTAPMPGTVIRVLVVEGDPVTARQPLLVLEAMKMETPLVSPYEGVVRRVHVHEGDRVAGGALLVELD
jgi:acetyl/propionyl-CoA carboxylase alpha subunit